jgi:hypothetical protein
MVSSEKIDRTKTNFKFVMSIVIISNLISCYLNGNDMFSTKWLGTSFAITFAYILYAIFIEDLKILKKFQNNKIAKNTIQLGAIIALSKIINGIFQGTISTLSSTLSITLLFKIGTYIIFDYFFIDKILDLTNYSAVFYDLSKLVLSELAIIYVVYSEFSSTHVIDLVAFGFGYIIWNLIIKNFI